VIINDVLMTCMGIGQY